MTEFYKSRSVTERVYMDLFAIVSSKKRPGDVKLNYETMRKAVQNKEGCYSYSQQFSYNTAGHKML